VLYIDVIKVDRDVAHVAYIASVSDKCCKRFDLDVALHILHTYVVRVCFKCFIYFSFMLQQVFSCCKLQVFYLDVAYVAVAIHVCYKCMFQMFQLF
jgi:hypothetical protein